MASVRIDSELMTNYISAASVAAGQYHVAVLDERRMPMLFILRKGERPRLDIIRKDAEGQSQQFSIANLIGLPENIVVQSFNVQQDWNLKLYLVVAYRESDNTSALIVVKPFLPEQLRESAASLPLVSGDQTVGTVQNIHMTPLSGMDDDFKYPDIFLVHRQINQAASWGSDIKHICVQESFSGWVATQELETPANVSEILDIAPAISLYGQGLYVLYVARGETRIFARFLRPDPYATDGTMYDYVTEVQCPKGARCIASFLGTNGYTQLLVSSAEGLRCLSAADSVSKDRPGTLIFGEQLFKNIRELHTVQDKEDLTLWFRNVNDDLAYTRTKTDDLKAHAVSSLILPASLSTVFAPVTTSASDATGQITRQMLISNDRDGNLTLLEQSSDIGLWRKTPFMAPSPSGATELKSYTVTIRPRDAQQNALSNGSVLLSASSSLTIISNGRHTLLKSIPTWFDCDSTGSLDFIIPSDSLGSQGILIDRLRDSDGEILDIDRVYYDPARKPMSQLMEKLGKVKSDDDFKSLKTSNGEQLLPDDVRGDKDTVAAARKCLSAAAEAYALCSLTPPGSSFPSKQGSTTTEALVRATIKNSKSLGDIFMDGWRWVCEKIEDVKEWVVEAAGTVWNFACKIAGEVKTFVLDCAEKICEAATWVWEKVKVGWGKLCDFIGFIFNWGDIIQTKNTISAILTAGLDYAALEADDLASRADSFFNRIEGTFDTDDTGYDSSEQSSPPGPIEPESKDVDSSTAMNWVRERTKNGSTGKDATGDIPGNKKVDEAANYWTNDVVPAVEALYGQLDKLGTDITTLFKKEGSISTKELKKICGRALKAGIIALRIAVKVLLKAAATFARMLKDIGNFEIDYWKIITSIYSKVSGGHALTIFDLISLIIAIPTTVVAKLITKKAPPTFAHRIDHAFMKQMYSIGGLDAQTKTDWAVFKAELAIGISTTVSIYKTIDLLYKATRLDDEKLAKSLTKGPTTFMKTTGIIYNMLGAFTVFPTLDDLPGATYRKIIGTFTCARAGWHTIALCAKSKGGPVLEKTVYYLDLVTVLACAAAAISVGFEEHTVGKKWKDYNKAATDRGFGATVTAAMGGIGYFTAWRAKDSNPTLAAGAVAIMSGTTGVTALINADILNAKYKRMQAPYITNCTSF